MLRLGIVAATLLLASVVRPALVLAEQSYRASGVSQGLRWEGEFRTNGELIYGTVTLTDLPEIAPLAALGEIKGDEVHVRIYKDGVHVSDFIGATDGDRATGTVTPAETLSTSSSSTADVDLVLNLVSSTACNPAEDVCGPAPKE